MGYVLFIFIICLTLGLHGVLNESPDDHFKLPYAVLAWSLIIGSILGIIMLFVSLLVPA